MATKTAYTGADLNPANQLCVATRVSVSDVETTLAYDPLTPIAGRTGILIRNAGTSDLRVYFSSGASDYITVTPGNSLSLPLGEAITVYGKCATGESTTAEVVEYV